MRDMREEARRLGLGLEHVTIASQNARRALRDQAIAELQSGIDALADRAADLRDRFAGILDPLLDFEQELAGVGASPAQAFADLNAEFERIAALARGGDIAAIQRLPDVGRALIDAAAEFGASPLQATVAQDVGRVISHVVDRTESARDEAMRGLTAITERIGRDTIATMIAEGRETRAELQRLRREMQQVVANTSGGRRVA